RVVAAHQAINTFDAIVDVTVGTRLLAVAPDFDRVFFFRHSNFATDSRGRFLAAAIVSSKRTEDVVEPDDARLQAKVFAVVAADALHVKLLPTVAVLGV